MTSNQSRTAIDQEHALVGREVIAESDGSIVDISVELLPRPRATAAAVSTLEPPDKDIIALHADARDAATAPLHLRLDSGPTRQLAATLIRAADLADHLTDHTG